MKTRIYVDGYNFYYGCLKNTPFKWLDVFELLTRQTLPANCHYTDPVVKYFTAEISDKAAHNPSSVKDQQAYHRALKAIYPPEKLELILGHFDVKDAEAYLIEPSKPKALPKDCNKVTVWKMEEKQSDVNLAIESVKDALTLSDLEQIVFVTNDSDISPALRMIKQLRKNIRIGVITPTKEQSVRRANERLLHYADWHLDNIRNSWLKRSQLPRVIHQSLGKKLRKPIVKPNGWFGQPELVEQIMTTLLPVCSYKRANCWKWLNEPKPVPEGLPELDGIPVNLLDAKEDAEAVLLHAQAYAKYKKGC